MNNIIQIKQLEVVGPNGRQCNINRRYFGKSYKRLFDTAIKRVIQEELYFNNSICTPNNLNYFIVSLERERGYLNQAYFDPNHTEHYKEHFRGQMPYERILRYYYE